MEIFHVFCDITWMRSLFFCVFSCLLKITELLDDDKCEAECEELPQDGEEGLASSNSPQHSYTYDSPATRWDWMLLLNKNSLLKDEVEGVTCDEGTWQDKFHDIAVTKHWLSLRLISVLNDCFAAMFTFCAFTWLQFPAITTST